MAYARTMCKAAKIDRLKKRLITEKTNSIKLAHGEKIKLSIGQKYRHFCIDIKLRVKKCFRNCLMCPEGTCIHKTCVKLQNDGTCENFVLKSVIGFISGFLLTYIFFMFFVFQLNFKLPAATMVCSILGSILTIGLAFSYKIRCIVLLILPQFFSKRGRQALLAYALILALTGPAKNTLNNMSILSESLACGQEQLKAAVRQIIEVIKKPFYAIKDAIKAVVKTVKEIVKKIKEILLGIKRVVMAILKVIKAAFQFLGKIINICNKELGTPFQRCTRVFEDAITDCNAKLGPLFNWLCSIVYLVEAVCYIVKIFDFICMIVDFINDSIIAVVIRKVKIFIRHIKTMFYVRIKFSHSYHFQTTQSKSLKEVAAGIVKEVKQRTENLMTVFNLMSCATTLFFIVLILRVVSYRYRFLTSERFDNKYITKDFRKIDLRRAQMEKETVLPLNHRERSLYISVDSVRLVDSEKKKLGEAAVVLAVLMIKMCIYMMADYSLYWILTLIRYHARFQSKVQAPNVPTLHIEGTGLLADLLKSIVKAFQPLGIRIEIDTVPCLPDPIPPDFDRYVQIAILLLLCWVLTVFEPYGLRLRHSVMCYYHPTRAKQRAIWLYNHILRSRSSFIKFARRQLRRKVLGQKNIEKVTCKEYLRARINSPVVRFCMCLGEDKQNACILCGQVFRESDRTKPIRCKTPGCPGIYCAECFNDLQNLCTICLSPIDYGDVTDISEEKDSSEEEMKLRLHEQRKKGKKTRKKRKWYKCFGRKKDKDSDDTDETEQSLIKFSNENEDSDYTTDRTSELSYSYQDEKDVTKMSEYSPKSSFTDLEKQRLPDYATMDSARESEITIIVDSTSFRSDEESDNTPKKPTKMWDYFKRGNRKPREEIPLLPLDTMETSSDKTSDFPSESGTPQTPATLTGSSISTETSIHTFKSSASEKSDVTKPKIPRLKLDRESKISDRFKNIKYEVIDDTTSTTAFPSTPSTAKTPKTETISVDIDAGTSKDFTIATQTEEGDRDTTMDKKHRRIRKVLLKVFGKKKEDSSRPSLASLLESACADFSQSSLFTESTKSGHRYPKTVLRKKRPPKNTPCSYMGSYSCKEEEVISASTTTSFTTSTSRADRTASSEVIGARVATNLMSANKQSDRQTDLNDLSQSRYSREPPERDRDNAVHFDVCTNINECREQYERGSNDSTSLSEEYCENILGMPCRHRRRRARDCCDCNCPQKFQHYDDTCVGPSRDEENTSAMRDRTARDTLNARRDAASSYEYANTQSASSPDMSNFGPPEQKTQSTLTKICACSSPSATRNRACQSRNMEHPGYRLERYKCSRCSRSCSRDRRNTKHTKHCCCRHCKDRNLCHIDKHCGDETDQESACSDDSRCTGYMDLTYQNKDEYLDLVQELEDTLSQRNKARVQKTMMEFERLSKQNKNLERPIFDDEETTNPCTLPKVVKQKNQRHSRHSRHRSQEKQCCCTHKNFQNDIQMIPCRESRRETSHDQYPCRQVCHDIYHREPCNQNTTGYVDKVVKYMSPKGFHKIQHSSVKSRWELNPRTGEWYKVYENYNNYDIDYNQPPPPPPPPPPPLPPQQQHKVCHCDYYADYERNFRRNSQPRFSRNMCCKCGLPHDSN